MFSFFLRSKLVITNLLQFIKFLSRTQSLFLEGENRKLSPGAVRLYYVRSEPGVHIHTPAGRIYRTMQPAAYQRIVTPYMPDSAKAGSNNDQTEWPTLRQSVKQGSSKSLLFAFNFMCLLFKHTDRPFYAPLPPMCKGTQIKRETANFSAVSFLLIGMRVQTAGRTHRPRFHKNQSNTHKNPSAHNPPDTLPPGADFAPFSAAQFCFAEFQTP